MKVRAKADGLYGGYNRTGPFSDEQGNFPGEVFEIDATPHPMLDDLGKPIHEMEQTGDLDLMGRPVMRKVWVLDGSGKPKKDDRGQLIPKIRMATAFSSSWMEPVNDDATVDYPERTEPFGILPQMRPPRSAPEKVVAARPVDLPKDVAALVKSPI